MGISVKAASLQEIAPWRDQYRQEMNCQVVHDSIHGRDGWTREFALLVRGTTVGYGSLAVAGPWKERPTIYEFHVVPQYRVRIFDLFQALLTASGAVAIETQTNGILLPNMLHAFAHSVSSESILFHDQVTTCLPAPPEARFRRATLADRVDSDCVVEIDGQVAAKGGILFHYNRPYGDIYMEVTDVFRRRGLGSYLVQELKRVCYEQGSVPAARCSPDNARSRRTLQRAGFVPCGHLVSGAVSRTAG
jgi:GNAT superfamily N-acetyltransferase